MHRRFASLGQRRKHRRDIGGHPFRGIHDGNALNPGVLQRHNNAFRAGHVVAHQWNPPVVGVLDNPGGELVLHYLIALGQTLRLPGGTTAEFLNTRRRAESQARVGREFPHRPTHAGAASMLGAKHGAHTRGHENGIRVGHRLRLAHLAAAGKFTGQGRYDVFTQGFTCQPQGPTQRCCRQRMGRGHA